MFEKVSPAHPDKIADRIAGAIVDLAYKENDNPHIAVEVLIGHGHCKIIIESDTGLYYQNILNVVYRIGGILETEVIYVEQDKHLNDNQKGKAKCGDNGIFKGVNTNEEEECLTHIVEKVYETHPYDSKFIINDNVVTACVSNISEKEFLNKYSQDSSITYKVNPLGEWTGGVDVDCGATNRKLGSDMGRAATGGGLHGKDLSKADVTLNICAFLCAQHGKDVEWSCSIGDEYVNGIPYEEYVTRAKKYIDAIGGFEKFAEWGLIR